MRRILSLLIILLAISCDDKDPNAPMCIRGEITGWEYCTNFSIIELKDKPIGVDIEYAGKQYKNAIKVLGASSSGVIYFRVRKFDDEADAKLVERFVCYALYAPMPASVPKYVIVAQSTTGCP